MFTFCPAQEVPGASADTEQPGGSHPGPDTITAFESKVRESLPLPGLIWLILSSAWEFPAF